MKIVSHYSACDNLEVFCMEKTREKFLFLSLFLSLSSIYMHFKNGDSFLVQFT